jgi:hypothetical protein
MTKQPDYEKLFKKLWNSVHGIGDACLHLKKDATWGDEHPDQIYVSKNSPGQGAEFALYRARRWMDFDDLMEFKKCYDDLKAMGFKRET